MGRVASCEWRVASGAILRQSRGLRISAYSLQPTAYSLRHGISLLEVLISMFVLLFGLMGVAMVFPIGNHYAGKGEQYDRGVAMAEAAFADIKGRGMLQPGVWIYSRPLTSAEGQVRISGSVYDSRVLQPSVGVGPGMFTVKPTINPPNIGWGHAFVIDPIGAAAGNSTGVTGSDVFPFASFDANYRLGKSDNSDVIATNTQNPWDNKTGAAVHTPLFGARWPIRRVTVPSDNLGLPTMTSTVAESICRLRDDVASELPKEDDRPGMQRWRTVDVNPTTGGKNNTPDDPSDDTPLTRQYGGSYSWLATIVPTSVDGLNALQPNHPQYGSELYDVSVAVFHKRDATPSAATERTIAAQLNLGGELIVYGASSDLDDNVEMVDAAVDGIRAGQWIALAGIHPTNVTICGTANSSQLVLKWYRVLSIDDETNDDARTGDVYGVAGPIAFRRLMLDGPGWPAPVQSPAGGTTDVVENLRAILMPGIIGVSTHTMPLEGHGSGRGSYYPAATTVQKQQPTLP